MSSTNPPGDARSSDQKSTSSKAQEKTEPERRPQQDGMRETVESIAVAFILAFLFRAFEAEAFVIPTGSMAPTLYGRHKDVTCKECGFHFEIGASDEVDENVLRSNRRIQTAFCPNCRYENDVFTDPVFNGDRILVTKFPYEIGSPSRWDVAVFKFPEDPTTNYIKRLVGLPNETLLIERGNLYTEVDGKLSILRKDDPNKQRAIQIPVYDHTHSDHRLHEYGWPKRWASVAKTDGDNAVDGWTESETGWVEQPDSDSFTLKADDELRWLRYRNFLPGQQEWEQVLQHEQEREGEFQFTSPRPQLIADMCSYNEYLGGNSNAPDFAFWVGDLSLSCQLKVSEIQEKAKLLLELNEGVRRYRCVINPRTGEATLSHNVEISPDDEEVEMAKAKTPITSAGKYNIYFCNVDDRLCLWVNNQFVDFGVAAAYDYPKTAQQNPTDADLIPIGIAASGMTVTVSDMLIERDIYYRGEENSGTYGSPGLRQRLAQRLADPAAWGRAYSEDENLDRARFEIGPDQFFALGDNSPRSKDGRLWSQTHTVPRSALVGKAFFIYWPHGVPFMNNGRGYPDDAGKPRGERSWLRHVPGLGGTPLFYHKEVDVHGHLTEPDYPKARIPFYPHFSRMRRIR